MNEIENYPLLARIVSVSHPEIVEELKSLYSPVLTDQSLVKEIFHRILSTYPDLEQYDRNVLIVATIYTLYCPAALIGCQNAPANLRKVLADLLGYSNGTNINYWVESK